MASRKKFIETTALGITGLLGTPLLSSASFRIIKQPAGSPKFPVGIAGYTFAKIDLTAAIAMMQRLGVHNLSVKDVHLPLDSSPEKIASVLAQFKAAGITVYTVGVIYMKTKEAVDQAFTYAKNVGVDMIVGVPNYELLDYTEEKVKATNIRIAIHNHGPEDKLYPGPKDVFEHIKNRDARMGLCLDIGHAQRAGVTPADAVNTYKQRIFDLHIKDVNLAAAEGKAMEIGRGIINFNEFIKSLSRINYKGVCSIEFEKDMTDPLPGIAESLGYFKGVMASV